MDISEQGNITALIQGQRISFGIEEPIRKVVTQKPRVPNPTDRWDYDEVVTFEPSGMLALIIHSDNWDSRALRKRWSDAKIQRIEILIPDFVAGLMRVAVILRQKEEERKRHELEEQKRTQELARLRKEIEEEEKKLEQFKNWVENWERAEQMRRFIAAYAEKSQSWAAEKQPKHRQWVEWATRQADRLDPFVQERPASVLDRKHEAGTLLGLYRLHAVGRWPTMRPCITSVACSASSATVEPYVAEHSSSCPHPDFDG